MTLFDNEIYVIVPSEDVTQKMQDDYSEGRIIKTLDGSEWLFSFDGQVPSSFDGFTTRNHSEIITYKQDNISNWEKE